MRLTLGRLRAIIRESAFPGQPAGRNVLSPDINSREQLGSLAAVPIDTVADPEGLPDHLSQPTVTPEECLGPVPPETDDPGVYQDPFARDWGVTPTPAIKRG